MKQRAWCLVMAVLWIATLSACAPAAPLVSNTDTTVTMVTTQNGQTTTGATETMNTEATDTEAAGTTATKATDTTVGTTQTTVFTPMTDGKHITFFDKNAGTIGVWWWHNGLAKNSAQSTKYLDFLQSNQVSEIYIWADGMTNDQMATFIRAAGSRGMRVAWLSGDVSWIATGNTAGDRAVKQFTDYQKQAADDAKFYALHLDVEPHQRPDFSQNRAQVLQMYADYAARTAHMVHEAGGVIEWDIPFWLNTDYVEDEQGNRVPLLERLAKTSDTLCLMSYRDTAKEILNVSKEEIALGERLGCKIVCGVETYSTEGNQVSFMEEGKRKMYAELETVYNTLKTKALTGGYGVAIHHLTAWEELTD